MALAQLKPQKDGLTAMGGVNGIMKAWNRYAGHRRPLPIEFIFYIVVACIRHSRIGVQWEWGEGPRK